MSLSDFDLSSQPAEVGDPMKAACLKLQSAKRELAEKPSYERAVEVQLAQAEVNKLASIARREIRRVS